jgi:serine/threonine-protein kinase
VSGKSENPIPTKIGKYDIVGVLGRGGMGVVYRARDSRIGRDVAIKTLTEGFVGNPDMLKRFYQEAGHTGNLSHPNIVIIHDFGDEDGLPYIVMQYVDGDPLDKLIREGAPLHFSEKLYIIEQVCSALAYAHLQGIVHRDVKPANIIVQRDGLVKLLDFGIARTDQQKMDGTMTRTGTLVGTPAYMAPERLQGSAFDGRSDIFSVGVVLYQFVTGALPFDAQYPAILDQILHQDPPPFSKYLASYPTQLDQVIQHSLAKKPADRYAQASDMATDLNAISAELRSQRISDLLTDAHSSIDSKDFVQAKQYLRQALRLDSHHTDAKSLMAKVNEYITAQEIRRRVEQLIKSAEEALKAREWDHAKALCAEGLGLDHGRAEFTSLLERANTGKELREKIQRLLREAEEARNAGNYDSASACAKKASSLDPSDSRILAMYRALEKEAEDERRRVQVRKLLQKAQEDLTALRLDEAERSLTEVEKLDPSDPDLVRLKDEVAEAARQGERKRLVLALHERSLGAFTLEQIQSVMRDIRDALEKFPTEPILVRLKMQLEPRLKEHFEKRLVADLSESYKQLPAEEALARVREGLQQLPGNPDLLRLEDALSRKAAKRQREMVFGQYLAQARSLLDDNLYLEAVKVLEHAEREGFSSPELTELMEMAKAAAAKRIFQDLVERSFLEAKQLLADQNYEAVMRLLPPVLERVEEPSLRRQLDEASQMQRVLEERIEHIVARADGLCRLGLSDVAIGLIGHEESKGVKDAKRVQRAIQSCQADLNREGLKLSSLGGIYAALENPDSVSTCEQITLDHSEEGKPSNTTEVESHLAARLHVIADQKVTKSIDASRHSLASDDPALAEKQLQSASVWLSHSNPDLQTEWKNAQSEISAAKKVLRFRRASRQ